MIRLASCAAIFFVYSLPCCPQTGMSYVSGHVYGPDDRPIARAHVSMFPLESAWTGPLPSTLTDDKGSYTLKLPAVGKARIYAAKEEMGYPDTFYSIFASTYDNDPVEELTPNSNYSGIDLHLGEPDGTIELSVIDKISGAIVPRSQVLLSRKDTPDVQYHQNISGGTFIASLPEKPISIQITANGYRPWVYKSSATGEDFVQIRSLEHLKIRAEMIPLASAP